MRHPIRFVLASGLALSVVGNAFTQEAYPQGTISRQRPVLTDYTSTGWLSDHAEPRFWFWSNGLVFDPGFAPESRRYPALRRWAHGWVNITPGYLLDQTGAPDSTKIHTLALDVFNKSVTLRDAGEIVDAESFAFFIQHCGLASNLFRNTNDDLATVYHADGITPYQWEVQQNTSSGATSANTATPWRSSGVNDAGAVFQIFLSDLLQLIQAENAANDPSVSGIPDLPLPSRFFLDDENGYFVGSGSDMIAVYDSILSDPRTSTETLHGDFTNWTGYGVPTTVGDIFGNGTALGDFNTAYTPWYSYTPIPNNAGDQHQFHDFITHRSILNATNDGAEQDAIEPYLHAAIPGCLWSNYATSGWYSEEYPRFSRGDTGAPYPCASTPQLPIYGWTAIPWNGSADMQSPQLYPVHHYQSYEYDVSCGFTPSDADQFRTSLRHNRQDVDHAIFSFEVPGMSTETPHHITPWVARAKTAMTIPGGSILVTKTYTRDVLAMCKAKGINEAIFWGSADTTSSSEDQWVSTNDAISQVWDYNLSLMRTQPGNYLLTPTELAGARFSEEHTYDITPSTVFVGGASEHTATAEMEFSVASSLTELGQEYTLILETIDGGGPWANAAYTVKVRNFDASSYENIVTLHAGTYEKLLSTSTRRVIFEDDDPSNGLLYDSWSYGFDDDTIVGDVTDRKSIHKWTFTLPSDASDYLHPSHHKMKFWVSATQRSPLPVGVSADPLRLDLAQLYESELEDDNVNSTPRAAGDINKDGAIDQVDLRAFVVAMASGQSATRLDLDESGAVDIRDVQKLIDLINRDY